MLTQEIPFWKKKSLEDISNSISPLWASDIPLRTHSTQPCPSQIRAAPVLSVSQSQHVGVILQSSISLTPQTSQESQQPSCLCFQSISRNPHFLPPPLLPPCLRHHLSWSHMDDRSSLTGQLSSTLAHSQGFSTQQPEWSLKHSRRYVVACSGSTCRSKPLLKGPTWCSPCISLTPPPAVLALPFPSPADLLAVPGTQRHAPAWVPLH